MKFFEILIDAIKSAEENFGAGNGELKKQQVVEVINALVDIPHVPEFIEAEMISLIIDLVVYIFKRYKLFPPKQEA